MNPPNLDPDLAAALQVLAELGPLQVLDLHPTPPGRQPAPPPAPVPAAATPPQPSLFQPQQPPVPALTNPPSSIPLSRRWRPVLRHTGAPRSPTPPTWRSHP
jgi:hypothetical protein